MGRAGWPLRSSAQSWLSVYVFEFGVVGLCVCFNLSWCFWMLTLLLYTTCGGCPLWTKVSTEAFSGYESSSNRPLLLELFFGKNPYSSSPSPSYTMQWVAICSLLDSAFY
ncbi:hypothetical protein NL676_026098 [Syzygium grande]|nr:hypothetical protein NL676_026098 [Syzygium grande]